MIQPIKQRERSLFVKGSSSLQSFLLLLFSFNFPCPCQYKPATLKWSQATLVHTTPSGSCPWFTLHTPSPLSLCFDWFLFAFIYSLVKHRQPASIFLVQPSPNLYKNIYSISYYCQYPIQKTMLLGKYTTYFFFHLNKFYPQKYCIIWLDRFNAERVLCITDQYACRTFIGATAIRISGPQWPMYDPRSGHAHEGITICFFQLHPTILFLTVCIQFAASCIFVPISHLFSFSTS